MGPGRVPCWSHEIPSEMDPTLCAAVSDDVGMMLDAVSWLLQGPNGASYTATEMVPFQGVLGRLAAVDPRGGYFAQVDVALANASHGRSVDATAYRRGLLRVARVEAGRGAR